MNIPVWNWGATHSRVKQASLRAEQAGYDLTNTERTLSSQLASGYREAETALSQVRSLQESADLSNESLRLTLLGIRPAKQQRLKWWMHRARPTLLALPMWMACIAIMWRFLFFRL